MMRAIKERGVLGDIWHLPDGPAELEAIWHPIKCGGGIALPGHIEDQPREMICLACLRAAKR